MRIDYSVWFLLLNIVAVDAAYSFSLSLEAMDALTGGINAERGAVTAVTVQVEASVWVL